MIFIDKWGNNFTILRNTAIWKNFYMKKQLAILIAIPFIVACQPIHKQNRFNYSEVGKNVDVEFARVVSVKEVDVQGRNTGIGSAAGMAVGSAAGYQFGNGNGQLGAMIAGMVIGGIAGNIAEQEAQNQKGFQYIVVNEKKQTKRIVQNQSPEDKVFKKGDRVIIETSGEYQRVLPTDDLPAEIKRPKGIKVVD